MTLDRLDVAKWTEATTELAGKLEGEADKVLTEDAARGFPAPSGDALGTLLEIGQDVKMKLITADGKIYAEQRQVIFEQDEFAMKIFTKIAKLALELYRERLFNVLAMEQAEAAEKEEREASDVDRENAETESRQIAIIQGKAEVEQSILVYKRQLVSDQYRTMAAERILIEAQLETAEKKLEIINSIYKVLAAEQLVLAAENRRAAALQLVLVAEREIAEIKKGMVPLYLDKAQAELDLAAATIAELPILKALEALGFERAGLKAAAGSAEAAIIGAEVSYQGAVQAYVTAETAYQIAKQSAHLLLANYHNSIAGEIENLKVELDLLGVQLRLETQLKREQNRAVAEEEVAGKEADYLGTELDKIATTLGNRGADIADAITASATQTLAQSTTSTLIRQIFKGGGVT